MDSVDIIYKEILIYNKYTSILILVIILYEDITKYYIIRKLDRVRVYKVVLHKDYYY